MELVITFVREEAEGVRTFGLQPADGNILPYKAGQFLTLLHQAHGRELRRSYSLSGASGTDDIATITVKRIANGIMSRRLIDSAATGDILHCEGGATGIFTLPQDLDKYHAAWFFAAGIGITPVFSLLKALLRYTAKRAVLVYSNRSRADTVFYQALLALEAQYGNRLSIVWLWSDTQDMRRARLSKESFPAILHEYLREDPARVLCYVCGPMSYMWLVQLLLQDAGVAPEEVRREVFVVDKDIPKRLPADKEPHRVTVHTGRQAYSFVNTYPESILASARIAGVPLPYSCEAGQCGSCTATCTEGKVWMSYNEVLTEKDMTAGRILTCTGHAVGGDIVLKL